MFFEKKLCKCCKSQIKSQFCVKNKKYNYCDFCKSVFLDDEFLLSKENQVDRYLLHNNTLDDSGYKTYLEKFLQKVILHTNLVDVAFLDYGSGPHPCLVELAKVKYPNFEVIEGWDLYFTKDFIPRKNFYSLITCLEVAEHFENPEESFRHIFSLLKKGGLLAVQTQFFVSESEFEQTEKKFATWWYKEDTTHVTFYSKEGLVSCCSNCGLEFVQQVDKNLLIFVKKD